MQEKLEIPTDSQSAFRSPLKDGERRANAEPEARILGRLVSCSNNAASVRSHIAEDQFVEHDLWAVGRLLTIQNDNNRIIGVISRVEAMGQDWDANEVNPMLVRMNLVGEIREVNGKSRFERKIGLYPPLGAITHRTRAQDMQLVEDQLNPMDFIGE